MSILMAVFLGLVQGLTEFLPVSSSGHLSVLQNLLNLHYSEAEHMFFDVLLHMGTLLAVLAVYARDIKAIAAEAIVAIKGNDDIGTYSRGGRFSPNVRLLVMVIFGTLPLLIVLPFYSSLEKLYSNTIFIAFAFMATGAVLYLSDRLESGKKTARTMTVTDALIVGAAQAIAVVPGLSRSGSTVAASMSCGLRKDFALKFSMLLSIPAVLGSMLISFLNALSVGIDWSLLPVYLIGVVTAAVSGFFALLYFRQLIAKNKYGKISYYCFGAGAVTLILSLVL